MKSTKLFSYVEVTDDTPVQKLGLLDQVRLLVRKLTASDAEQLRADDAETIYYLQLRANLQEFLYKATEAIRRGEHSSVTVEISSKFEPVLEEVLASSTIATYYSCTVRNPNIEYDIEYFIPVTLEVKTY